MENFSAMLKVKNKPTKTKTQIKWFKFYILYKKMNIKSSDHLLLRILCTIITCTWPPFWDVSTETYKKEEI